VAVAVDRRPSCRVEIGFPGVELESKDALRKASGESLSALAPTPAHALAVHVLRSFGLESGVRVATHARLPEGTGLADGPALAAALAGAVAAALDRPVDRDAIERAAAEAALRAGVAAAATGAEAASVRGQAVVFEGAGAGGRAEPLRIDPARVEECLLLVDVGAVAEGAPPPGPDTAPAVAAALREARYEALVDLWAEEWAARERTTPGWPPAEAARLAGLVRAAGGAARILDGGRGRLLAVWAPPGARGPGRRESVQAALREAGVRAFPARVDLRGLEVE
jgi:hypothetical protein